MTLAPRFTQVPLDLFSLLVPLKEGRRVVGSAGDTSFFLSLANFSRGFKTSPNRDEDPPVFGRNGCSINHSFAGSGTRLGGHLARYAFLLANIDMSIVFDRNVLTCAVARTSDLHITSLVSMSASEIGSLALILLMPPVNVSTAETASRALLDCCSMSTRVWTGTLALLESTPEYLSNIAPGSGASGVNMSLRLE